MIPEEWIAGQMQRLRDEAEKVDILPGEYALLRISAEVTAIRQMIANRLGDDDEGEEWKG